MAVQNLLWDITPSCNLKCLHCYNSDMIERGLAHQQDSSLDNIEETIKKISDLGFTHIHLLGGEPLMYPLIYDVLHFASFFDISTSINTNGTLLTESVCQRLIKEKVSQIVISLDGAVEGDNDIIRGSGVFKQVTDNIKSLSLIKNEFKANLKIELAVVVTKVNLPRIHQIVILAKDLGIDIVNISELYHHGNANKHMNLLSINALEYYSAIKKIIAYALFIHQKVQIDCKSIVLKQIYNELGINAELESNYDSCQAGKNMIYMNSYKELYPCGPYASQNPNGPLKIHLFHHSAQQIIKKFAIEVEKIKELPNDVPCLRCRKRETCSLCPLCKTQSIDLCATAFKA